VKSQRRDARDGTHLDARSTGRVGLTRRRLFAILDAPAAIREVLFPTARISGSPCPRVSALAGMRTMRPPLTRLISRSRIPSSAVAFVVGGVDRTSAARMRSSPGDGCSRPRISLVQDVVASREGLREALRDDRIGLIARGAPACSTCDPPEVAMPN